MPYLLFLKKQQNLKVSCAAKYRCSLWVRGGQKIPLAGKWWTFFNLADNLKFSIGEKRRWTREKNPIKQNILQFKI